MTTLKEIHDSAKILNPWIPALSSSHCAFKDTDCIGYSAGCRSEVQRVQVEVRVQDTTGRRLVQASAICRTVGTKNSCQKCSVSLNIPNGLDFYFRPPRINIILPVKIATDSVALKFPVPNILWLAFGPKNL